MNHWLSHFSKQLIELRASGFCASDPKGTERQALTFLCYFLCVKTKKVKVD